MPSNYCPIFLLLKNYIYTLGIMKVRVFWPQIIAPPQNQLDIYFLTIKDYWLDIAKPKNVFKSILKSSIKFLI